MAFSKKKKKKCCQFLQLPGGNATAAWSTFCLKRIDHVVMPAGEKKRKDFSDLDTAPENPFPKTGYLTIEFPITVCLKVQINMAASRIGH